MNDKAGSESAARVANGKSAVRDAPALGGRLDSFASHLDDLNRQYRSATPQQRALAADALEPLSVALEELRVAASELEEQNSALIEAQRQIASQRQRYQELFEFAPEAYFETDAHGVISAANAAAAQMLGVSPSRLVGKPLIVYVVAHHRPHMLRLLRNLATSQSTADAEFDVRTRRGRHVNSAVRVAVAGAPAARTVLWLFRDVTLRKQEEQHLAEALTREQEASDRLRELDSVKNAFLLGVSHDLRGPITAVSGLTHQLATELSSHTTDRVAAIIATLNANVARVQRVQANLIDLDRLARRAVVLDRRQVDVAELIEQAVDVGGFPEHPVSSDVRVRMARVDVALLNRILDNLVVNALQHTRPNTPVVIRASREPEGLLLTVADRGPGIPRDMRRHVFQPFVVGSSTRPDASPTSGMGIGLHLVASFAELHGGRAWIDETPGGGATFNVLLMENEHDHDQ